MLRYFQEEIAIRRLFKESIQVIRYLESLLLLLLRIDPKVPRNCRKKDQEKSIIGVKNRYFRMVVLILDAATATR